MTKKSKHYIILLFAALTICSIGSARAQRDKAFKFENRPYHDQQDYHFGFSLGFNKMDFSLKPISNLHNVEMSPSDVVILSEFDTLQSVLTRAENGFNIGIVSNLRLGSQLDLRFIPTLSFGDRNIIYRGIKDGAPITRRQQLESTFIEFPLHLKYKSVRMTNTRVYVIGGFKYSHDLASIEDKEDFEDEILARIGKNDVFYEMGVGFDYYFYYFKFSTEIKASFGMIDMLKRENTMFTNSIQRLNSKIIMISFLFE
ncbi:MAG: outer membrane beta-barrel protein [Bacteroidota bacterium]